MDLNTIGILSPGEMGSSIARTVKRHDLHPITTLEGRSQQTRQNARDAGVENVTPEEMAKRADVVLSVVVSDAVRDVARLVSEGARAAEQPVLFADMNPVAPRTVRSIATEFEYVDVVDGCIVGPASDLSRATFYVSGPRAADVAGLADYGVNANVIGDRLGQASGLKLCYGGMTKGLSALGMDLFLVATALNIDSEVEELYQERHPGVMSFLDGRLPGNPKRAGRRAQELEELATTLEENDVDGRLAQASAERLQWLASLELDTDDAPDAVETARRVFDATD